MSIAVVAVVLGYVRINRMYPPSQLIEVNMGEQLEFQEEVMITAEQAAYLSDEEKNALYGKMGEEPLFETKVLEVTLTLENISAENKKISMSDLYVESMGMANGISKNFIDGSVERYSSLAQELQPGEKKRIVLPYEILASQFTKRVWEQIKQQEIWLTFSSYPVKTKLNLNIK